MHSSSDAAEQIIRLSLESFEVAAKISGKGMERVAALLIAVLKDNKKTAGKTKLKNLLKSGKELKVFSIKSEDLKKFAACAKKYGVVYSVLIDKKNMANDGLVDIMVKSEDASRINRIIERFKMADYNETEIKSEVTKQKQAKTTNAKEKETQVNPHSEDTVKNPQSKSSSRMQKNSQGTNLKKKQSIKEKLSKAKEEVRERELIDKTVDKTKTKNVSKGKEK